MSCTLPQEKNIALEFMRTVWRRRRPFLACFIFLLLVALTYTLVAPKWYLSKVTFLVEPEVPVIPMISMIVETPLKLGAMESSQPSRYIGILNSRTILDKIIDEFDLEEVYEKSMREDLYDELRDNVVVIDNMNKTVSIICLFEGDRFKAAEMANAFYRHLEKLDERLVKQRATEFRIYMENSYRGAMEKLHTAEENLREYQNREGVVELEVQTKKLIEMVTDLESEKITHEMERDFLRESVEGQNPKLLEIMSRLRVLKNKIQSITQDSLYTTLILGELPDRSMEFVSFYREVTLQEAVIEYLTTQVEQAKIEEMKKSTTLFILDKGVPPERHFRPRFKHVLPLAAFFSFFLSIFFIQVLEYYDEWQPELRRIFKGEEPQTPSS